MKEYILGVIARIRAFFAGARTASLPQSLGAKRPRDPRLGVGVPEGIRRPERFIVSFPETTFTGTIVAIKREDDGDKHHRLLLDPPYAMFINEKNTAMQKGCLVFEIEPWQQGRTSTALGAEEVNGRPPSNYPTIFTVGQRVRITSPILLDTEHGWNESHAPRNVEILPPSDTPRLISFAEYDYPETT